MPPGPRQRDRDDPPYDRARETVNPRRLLPGEDAAGPTAGDAARWIGIYQELIAAKQALADCMTGEIAAVSDIARHELEAFDVTIIEAQQRRFRRRLAYWRGRAASLSGGRG
jgi:hypothetical protein